MLSNSQLKQKGLEVSTLYSSARRYFDQLTLLTQGVANLLADRGWNITTWNYQRPINLWTWSWVNDRCVLPKAYVTRFEPTHSQELPGKFGMSIWFYKHDPAGTMPWVPTGCFFRIILKDNGKYEDWKVDPQLAEFVRPQMFSPTVETVYQKISAPWPSPLEAEGALDQIQTLWVIPFPLAAVETSEDLETITTRAVQALSKDDREILLKDPIYMRLVWPLMEAIESSQVAPE